MSSSKNKDYDVEKIISKRTDSKGRILYLIKWKGYSSSDNTWEPENNVNNCPDLIKAFEAEQTEKNSDSNTSRTRTSNRSTRSSLLPSKTSTNNVESVSRTSTRNLSTRQQRKRTVSDDDDDSYVTEDEDDNENDYVEKKLIRSASSKRSRKSTSDTETTPSIDSHDSDILDTAKLESILDARRDKKTNTIEYLIQLKKIKKPVWIKSNILTEDYSQQVIEFLEEKFI